MMLNEYNGVYRQVFTDGRPLPQDPNPSWQGYSTATWSGDALVIETHLAVGIAPEDELHALADGVGRGMVRADHEQHPAGVARRAGSAGAAAAMNGGRRTARHPAAK